MFCKGETDNPNNEKCLVKTIRYKLYYVLYGTTTTAIANLTNIGPRVKSHFQLLLFLVFWSCTKKILHLFYNRGGLRRQRTEHQTYIPLHLQVDQFCKSFTTHVVSLNNLDLLLIALMYMQQQ